MEYNYDDTFIVRFYIDKLYTGLYTSGYIYIDNNQGNCSIREGYNSVEEIYALHGLTRVVFVDSAGKEIIVFRSSFDMSMTVILLILFVVLIIAVVLEYVIPSVKRTSLLSSF